MEQWKDVPGYEGMYEVSDEGRVRSLYRIVKSSSSRGVVFDKPYPSKMLREADNRGYSIVVLCKGGVPKPFTIHRLVMLAFVGPKPDGLQINHLNGRKDDNHVSNLEYCTLSENLLHRHRVLGIVSKRPPMKESTKKKIGLKVRAAWGRGCY